MQGKNIVNRYHRLIIRQSEAVIHVSYIELFPESTTTHKVTFYEIIQFDINCNFKICFTVNRKCSWRLFSSGLTRYNVHACTIKAGLMGFPKVSFRIVENRSCPLYEYSDSFALSGIAIPLTNNSENSFITTSIITYPAGKKICKILNGDLSKLVMQYERGDKVPVCMISCSGCTGSIKLEHSKKDNLQKLEQNTLSDELGSIMHLLSSFPFFKNIDPKNLDTVISYFRLNKYKAGDIVIRKGDPGGRFFVIVSGSVNVLNRAGIVISTLDTGEVFGEMSLICNDIVNATIQVKEESSILYIDQPNFHKILDIYPAIQLYFFTAYGRKAQQIEQNPR